MSFSSIVRIGLPTSALVVGLGMATALSAQTSLNFSFNSTITFPSFPPYPYTSDYVQCIAPAERQREDSSVQLQNVYEQNKILFVQRRGQSRMEAWMIPERSARSRAIRDSERAYRDAVRELDRWFRDQERAIRREFDDQEDNCDQFDTDVDSPNDGSSSSSRSSFSSSSFGFSSSSFVSCFGGDVCLPQQTCMANGGIIKNPGLCGNQSQMQSGYFCCQLSSSSRSSFSSQPICGNHICEVGEGTYCPPCNTFGCTNSCAIGTCPQDCQQFSSFSSSSRSSSSSSRSSSTSVVSCFGNDMCVPTSTCNAIGGSFVSPGACGNQSQMQAGYFCCRQSSSSSRWSSSSSWYWSSSSSWVFHPNNEASVQQGMQSCGCETVCDPSGSPCMAVCPAEC